MKNRILYYIGIGLATISLAGCDLDINKDPYAVTELDPSQLLTATEYEVAASFSEGYYLNANFSAYTQHTVSREIDNYSLVASYSTLGNTWDQAYSYAVKNCDALISQSEEDDNAVIAGIGRVLRVYMYMNMTDLWGDIPYSEANVPTIQLPKADKSEDIYNDLLKEINKAIANFKDKNAANTVMPAANDLFYRGDTAKWVKAANTLKLKLLVQSRLAKDQITGWQTELNTLLAEDNFIGNGEDLQFPHTSAIAPLDERKFGFKDEYEGGQKSVWISPWLYEIMNGKIYNFADNPFRNIVDPRCPYYYYCQASATMDAQNETDYRDGAFISIMMGSNSGYTSGTQDAVMTTLGIYPVGGKYDSGDARPIGASSGNGIAPDKMLQAYSVPFMKAELVLAGETTGDAKQLLKDGIAASIYHVNAVTKASDASAPLIADAALTTFSDAVATAFDAATAEKKMEIVMTQKWVANFFNTVEAYNDIRRTGYPKLFDGKGETREAVTPYAQTKAATPGLTTYQTSRILDYPRILWYPTGETDVNPNLTNKGRDVTKAVVFWDKKQ